MSDLNERIAEVLAGHMRRFATTRDTRCECGYLLGESPVARHHAAHQAEMLAPIVREAQRQAWNEGFKADPYSPYNPYKEKQ